MSKKAFQDVVRVALCALGLSLIALVGVVTPGQAAYSVRRPIQTTGGRVNQAYLYAEETVVNNQLVQHRGVDFSYSTGTGVYAIASGVVVDKREGLVNGERQSNWGNYVLIRHDERHYDRTSGDWAYVYAMYLHLSQNSVPSGVEEGKHVSSGQLVGKTDDTGRGSGGPHLHLQVVIHPNPNRNLEPYNSLESETRSRNPELWIAPYDSTGATARAVGRVADSSGKPVQNMVICGIQKPYGGYWWSRTYSYSWANADDYLFENFGTTDVKPGTYHLYAYPYQGSSVNTCSNPPAVYKDLGVHSFVGGKTTYIGLSPVYLPDIRSSTPTGKSTIAVRNNGSETAEIHTTLFLTSGFVLEQRKHTLKPNGVVEFKPSSSFLYGSALVVASQDISVSVIQELNNGSVNAAYTGVRRPTREVHVPLLHRNNSGWYSQLFIQNGGLERATVSVQFKPWNGLGRSCTRSYALAAHTTRRIDLRTSGHGCVTDSSRPTFVGSAYIRSDGQQPLAVTYTQFRQSGSTVTALMESSKSGDLSSVAYAPLIQNYNSPLQIISGLAMQNASTAANDLVLDFWNSAGTDCQKEIFTKVAPRFSAIDVVPPGPAKCPAVLSARVSGNNGRAVSATVNQSFLSSVYGSYWADYPAVSALSKQAIVPRWRNLGGWSTAIVVRNGKPWSISGTVTFYHTTGSRAGSPVIVSIPARGFKIVNAPFSSFSGSAAVSMNHPVALTINHFKASSSGDRIMSQAGDHR